MGKLLQGPPVRLENFLCEVLWCLGTPYIYGGKTHDGGLDCSGLVTWSLWQAGGPDVRHTHNTERLMDELEPVPYLLPGHLVFYKRHVVVHIAGGLVCGANGGNRETLTVEIARARAARVKLERRFDYRDDILGFRAIPFLVSKKPEALSYGVA